MEIKDEIIAALENLRGVKASLKQLMTEKERIEDEIEGAEDDVADSQKHVDELIKRFTEAGGEASLRW